MLAPSISKKFISVCLVLSIFCSFTNIYAVEGQFQINATVGADATAPSTPIGLIATAVSTSQIDLSWTASTDNVAVTGYKIYRDTVYVATVAGTTYSDIGLLSATNYSYTVSAIDATLNESAQSASASATTFTAPVAITGGGSPSGGRSPVIYDVLVTPSKTGATISWKTIMPTVDTLSWGKTQGYEMGTSPEAIASIVHSMSISGLTPATAYLYQIEAVNGYGVRAYLSNQSFITLSLEAGAINATQFTATARTSDILLKWVNPLTSGFSNVRVVRSDSFYPADPNDGEVIYEGSASTMTDINVVVGTRYYYTLFVKYVDGAYSSGLTADARIAKQGEVVPPVDVFESLPDAPRVHPLINALTFQDFDFIQDGKNIANFENGKTVAIDGNKNLTVSLDYSKVPEVLKTIAITLTDPEDSTNTFSFLLRVNSAKTSYIATIGPLGKSGKYGVRISIIDFKNRGLKKIVGSLEASVGEAINDNRNLFYRIWVLIEENFLNLILLLVLLYLVFRSLKAMVERNRKKSLYVCDIEADSSGKDTQ